MRDLTGAPGIWFDCDDPDKIFQQILEFESKNYLTCASSQATPDKGVEFKGKTGIISSHAYSILEAV